MITNNQSKACSFEKSKNKVSLSHSSRSRGCFLSLKIRRTHTKKLTKSLQKLSPESAQSSTGRDKAVVAPDRAVGAAAGLVVPAVQSKSGWPLVTECLECSGSSAVADFASVEVDSAPFVAAPCVGCSDSLASCLG